MYQDVLASRYLNHHSNWIKAWVSWEDQIRISCFSSSKCFKNSNSFHLSALPSLAGPCLTKKRECFLSFPKLAPAVFLQGLTGCFGGICPLLNQLLEREGDYAEQSAPSQKVYGQLRGGQASEQNWDSFGKGGGGHLIYYVFHSLFLCLEEIDNGVAKTFPPKFCTVWLDGNRLIQSSRGRCRLETQAITTLWIKSKLVLTSSRRSSCVGIAAAAEQERKRRRGLKFLFQLLQSLAFSLREVQTILESPSHCHMLFFFFFYATLSFPKGLGKGLGIVWEARVEGWEWREWANHPISYSPLPQPLFILIKVNLPFIEFSFWNFFTSCDDESIYRIDKIVQMMKCLKLHSPYVITYSYLTGKGGWSWRSSQDMSWSKGTLMFVWWYILNTF